MIKLVTYLFSWNFFISYFFFNSFDDVVILSKSGFNFLLQILNSGNECYINLCVLLYYY